MALTRNQAADLFRSGDLLGLGMEADALRAQLHPDNIVTYSLDRAVTLDAPDAAALEPQLSRAVFSGAGAVRLLFPESNPPAIDALEHLLPALRQAHPSLAFTLPASGLAAIARAAGISLDEALNRLHRADLDSLCSVGLDPHALATPETFTASLEAHRAAHRLGLRTTAAFIFGRGDTFAWLDQLEQLRALQEETGGLTAVLPLSAHHGRVADDPTAVAYLKVVSVARLLLDTVDTIQGTFAAQGLKVLQMALRCGANDAGSIHPEEATAAATREQELRRILRDAGFTPIQRDALYRASLLH
ncbi:hypothetical protein [Silvibacterium dinghuense]|uniref:CofH/MqnC-like C-terminal domain-containing protein n=1 Tax=Silvibacterium dinghuense TaxID=1560006 RepID=A0A4Q1SC16_9BACT|nr:hypothetical protein [Silvibacterium dinghuense]RXS94565.1 hypothetical protein ESZ00_16010 [Silvibacterium dinghuense]GGH15324.1 cyclic dehypoxanthine futalosine synthase [Silvibacterium dinghuense]